MSDSIPEAAPVGSPEDVAARKEKWGTDGPPFVIKDAPKYDVGGGFALLWGLPEAPVIKEADLLE